MEDMAMKMKDCIESCWACRAECQKTLFDHCLKQGGEHAAPGHVAIMTDCIQICQTAADFMTRRSPLHAAVCAACADVCEACADSCVMIGDEPMRQCAELCMRCAESCRDMGRLKKAA
jgi:hypothetical protein